ncbi:MAG: flagellar assembly peptidoglycan hydrolase FlgJ [Burkholderiaceae bacterium]|nr:flagellar assembly peptidoglycan hydrolase FlgJ [Burkholderiaceae bacterium]MDH3459371.1 flagellar assembly peptidoglycan hydrolase FlgJ [Burkholderiaceae bacterium]
MALTSSSSLLADVRSSDALRDPTLAALRARASSDPNAAIKEVAKQFEALFMQALMKSMRQATLSTGMLDNAGSELGTEMLDTQFATQMTGLPGGLGEAIARQLERQMAAVASPPAPPPAAAAAGAATRTELHSDSGTGRARQIDFLQRHQSAARSAEEQTGIPAAYMLGQAAHESGWGRREIRNGDGSSSYNVFGIKAGAGWNGPVAEVTTTEYIGGVARKLTQKFRAYSSYEESFRDYARLLKDNSRYARVLANADSVKGFAQGLQRAGYATDPAYADKLSRIINTTLRLQRAAA